MNDIKISVIMPVYRVEDYVGRAIECIPVTDLTASVGTSIVYDQKLKIL